MRWRTLEVTLASPTPSRARSFWIPARILLLALSPSGWLEGLNSTYRLEALSDPASQAWGTSRCGITFSGGASYYSTSSPVAIFTTLTALPIRSAGPSPPFGPVGITRRPSTHLPRLGRKHRPTPQAKPLAPASLVDRDSRTEERPSRMHPRLLCRARLWQAQPWLTLHALRPSI